ncbi:MarR family winged helix-turn-helix transcriptional regulator [Actinomadura yumaensis]|uniref:MarR family winged helix-turn-helix transcriptional regulator n=1 Tax=Actinomadura yumaensis TaxID=111807 RepID=A0ABW2CHZ2_9ACTN
MWSEQPEKRSEQPERTDPELPDLFLRAAKRIRRRQSRELAPLGLTPAQSRALRVIVGSRVPLRMVDLAGQLDIVPRSATSIVDALESAGLVTRAPDPANRRSLLVQPTPEGRAIRDRMWAARREAVEDVLSPLTDDQRATLRTLLTIIDAHEERPHGRKPC